MIVLPIPTFTICSIHGQLFMDPSTIMQITFGVHLSVYTSSRCNYSEVIINIILFFENLIFGQNVIQLNSYKFFRNKIQLLIFFLVLDSITYVFQNRNMFVSSGQLNLQLYSPVNQSYIINCHSKPPTRTPVIGEQRCLITANITDVN